MSLYKQKFSNLILRYITPTSFSIISKTKPHCITVQESNEKKKLNIQKGKMVTPPFLKKP
ncbi:hypothetical protein Hanom_Chr13g01237221 [Helianthus anomalus]